MAVEEFTVPSYPTPPAPPPPRLTVWQALQRQLPIALLPVIVLVGAAIAYGLLRDPTHESEARLNVGGLNLTQQSIQGYTAAVQQLAVAYSRAIHATPVALAASREAGISPQEYLDRVSATQIQGSSVIRVIAEGKDPAETRRLADAAADALVQYAINLNSGVRASGRLLKRFKEASRDFHRLEARLQRTPPGARSRRRLATQVDTARLEMRATGFLYEQSQAGQAHLQLVQKLAPAAPATSDRDSVVQDYVAGAAIGGVLIGLGLAVSRANQIARRRLGAP